MPVQCRDAFELYRNFIAQRRMSQRFEPDHQRIKADVAPKMNRVQTQLWLDWTVVVNRQCFMPHHMYI